MVEFDGGFQPFGDYPGYSLMAPCMRSCDRYLEFNVRMTCILHEIS
jgi:hypothetical protein